MKVFHLRILTVWLVLALASFMLVPGAAGADTDGPEGDPDAIGHSADGNYLDFSPFGKVELPRIFLVRAADGGLGLDLFASTESALEHGPYTLGQPAGNVLTAQQVEEAIGQHSHIYFPVVRTEGAILLDFSITRHLVFFLLACFVLVVLALSLASRYKRGIGREEAPRGTWQNLAEVFIVFIRDEVAKPTIGEKYRRYMPYLLTLFFVILFGNLFGLVPWGATATSNIVITGTLAAFTFVVTQFSGTKDYWQHIFNPPGVPLLVKPFIVPVEIIGLFTKPLALAFRLFGNMVSGHLVIVSILGLIFIFAAQYGAAVGWTTTLISVPLTVFIFVLKLAISFIQAYIFVILSALFIGLALEEHEHHDHVEEEAEEGAEGYHDEMLDQAEPYVPPEGDGTLEDTVQDGTPERTAQPQPAT